MIGQTISHYKITEKLGEGGMGVVYKAQDTRLRRTVALKFPPADRLAGEQHKARFAREAQAAAALNHPNICTVHEIDEIEGQAFIVMEFVEGQSVRERLVERPLPLKEALDIAAQAAQGLQAAHEKGIVHRDIKSANLMVTAQGQVKVMDFGLAQVNDRSQLTKAGTTLGTVAYMSPEQALAQPLDRRTDIWSLSVVLYEMLTGSLPFQGEVEGAVAYAIINTEPEPPTARRSGLPVEVDHIVDKALAKAPAERYQHVEDLLVDLRTLQRSMQTGEAAAISRRRRQVRRKNTIRKAAALAAVMLALTTVGLYVVPSSVNLRSVRDYLRDLVAGPRISSIAVLPLRNASGDPSQEYFSDGMTESLIASLAKVGSIRVISRTSVMRYKGSDKALPEVAKELGVGGILEGSIRRKSGHLLIDVTLFDAKTGLSIWGQSYDRELADSMILQSDISRDIARQIHVQLTPREESRLAAARRVDPEAYDLYIRGISYLTQLTAPGLDTAMNYFEQAREKDPALGWAGIAFVWLTRMQFGFVPASEAAPRAKAAALEALERDDNLPEIHLLLAAIKSRVDWAWEDARREFERALELNPNDAETYAQYARVEAILGNPNRAVELGAKALQLEPFRPVFQGMQALNLANAGRYEEALSMVQQALQQQPALKRFGVGTLCTIFYGLRRYDDLFQTVRSWFETQGDLEVVRALDRGHAESGYQRGLLLGADLLAARAKTGSAEREAIVFMYGYAGNRERTLEWMENLLEQHDPNTPGLVILPVPEDLRSNPRFQSIRRRMGLPPI